MIKALYAPMEEMEAFQQIRRRMQKAYQGMILAGGCIDSQKAHLIGCLSRDYPVTCILAPDDLRAREICENYRIISKFLKSLCKKKSSHRTIRFCKACNKKSRGK